MPDTVTIREVNQHTSAVFERVRNGAELVVTRGGRPLATIRPFAPADTYARMVADGRVIPAAPDGHPPLVPLRSAIDVDALIAEERADRDWR
ncbi:MAG: type II toxin-antitoxin system Phd/YefM family antitoxin [Actinomycetia bacterium]|nr:type II toxin-antitoxin system Phd/YefM family antitoxin [Actinomycetes bacterium]